MSIYFTCKHCDATVFLPGRDCVDDVVTLMCPFCKRVTVIHLDAVDPSDKNEETNPA